MDLNVKSFNIEIREIKKKDPNSYFLFLLKNILLFQMASYLSKNTKNYFGYVNPSIIHEYQSTIIMRKNLENYKKILINRR